jgi:hypothetical protein
VRTQNSIGKSIVGGAAAAATRCFLSCFQGQALSVTEALEELHEEGVGDCGHQRASFSPCRRGRLRELRTTGAASCAADSSTVAEHAAAVDAASTAQLPARGDGETVRGPTSTVAGTTATAQVAIVMLEALVHRLRKEGSAMCKALKSSKSPYAIAWRGVCNAAMKVRAARSAPRGVDVLVSKSEMATHICTPGDRFVPTEKRDYLRSCFNSSGSNSSNNRTLRTSFNR